MTPEQRRNIGIKSKIALALIFVLCGILFYIYYSVFVQRVDASASEDRFVVPLTLFSSTAGQLVEKGFVKSSWPVHLALFLRKKSAFSVEPGGYKISRAMTPWQITKVLEQPPYMKWVVLKEGLRKEEIAEILSKTLGWTDAVKIQWLTISTEPDSTHVEGVYFPDTYLIPLEETPDEVALRMRRTFEEKFAPLAKVALAKNIKWTTAVTIASLIQREAAGKDDMPIISGVIWNRLDKGMKLDIDATLQYIVGNAKDGWWGKVSPEDKKIQSPFNTYLNKGLPPHPIANPGFNALEAAVNPATTDCFYYLHADKKMYCSVTFEEHKQNIEKYLKK